MPRGGGRPLGSGRQLPPQLTVGRRPLGGGGGGGRTGGGYTRGRGAGAPGGSVGRGGRGSWRPRTRGVAPPRGQCGPEEAWATARAHRRQSAQKAQEEAGVVSGRQDQRHRSVTKQCNTKMTCGQAPPKTKQRPRSDTDSKAPPPSGDCGTAVRPLMRSSRAQWHRPSPPGPGTTTRGRAEGRRGGGPSLRPSTVRPHSPWTHAPRARRASVAARAPGHRAARHHRTAPTQGSEVPGSGGGYCTHKRTLYPTPTPFQPLNSPFFHQAICISLIYPHFPPFFLLWPISKIVFR